jgi:hypothetical protein
MDNMDLIRFAAMIIITNEAYHVFCPKERYFFEPRLLSGFPFLLWTVTSPGLTAGRGKYLPQSNPLRRFANEDGPGRSFGQFRPCSNWCGFENFSSRA